jgi:O-antigen ligase
MLVLFNAGFDHDVVYYSVFFMSIFMVIDLWSSKEKIKFNNISFSFLLFIIWAFASIIWSISPIRTVIEGIQLTSFLLLYLITRKLSFEGFDKLIKVLFLITGIIALIGILEYLFVSGSRIRATFTNPNPFGIYMVMIFLMALSGSIRKQSKALDFLSLLYLSVVLLSGSRASMGAMAMALFIPFLGLDRSQLKNAIIKTTLFFISAFIISQLLIYASLFIRENVIIDKSLLESITRSDSFVATSLKGRLEFWRVAFELFKNRPITGYGNGTYFSAYYIEYGMNEWYSRFTHNHYLQIASELGAIGVGLFLIFLWTGFRSFLYNYKQKNKTIFFWGMTAGLLAFLLHIGVDFTWNYPAVTALFFFFLGIATREDYKSQIKVSRRVILVGLIFIIIITTWHIGSIKLYTKALDMEQEESIDSALSLTEKINRIYPISSFGWSYESELLYKKYIEDNDSTDLENSFTAMEKALKNDPYDSAVNAKMAKLYLNTGDYKTAEKYYLISTKYSAYSLTSFLDLSNMYIELGEEDKAEETLLSALERAPFAIMKAPRKSKEATVDSVAIIHLKLANLYNVTGDKDKLQEQVNQLIELKDEYPFLEKYFK